MNSLPPFWVIGLAAARNRRDFVARGFAELDVEFETIDAIDGSRLTAADRDRYSHWRSLFHCGRGLSAGELGCALSHLEAYRRVVEAQIPEVVIFEDDVQPTHDLLRLLRAPAAFPPDADVVNFDPLFRSGGPTPVGAPLLDGRYHVCRYRRNPYGAACYRIRLAAAHRLLDVAYPVRMTADDLLFRPRPADIRWYGVEPSVVVRGDMRSELVARSDAVTRPGARVWEQPVVLTGKAVHKLARNLGPGHLMSATRSGQLLRSVWHRLPAHVRRRLLRARHWGARNRPGRRVRWGSFRRTRPFSDRFGLDRGVPVDRIYIADFVGAHAWDIGGNVLEVSRPTYARLFGGTRVAAVTVVDIDPDNTEATLEADLCERGSLPASSFECVIVTQTLQLLPDLAAALDNLWTALVPGGVLLITVPALSRDDPIGGDYWRFTPLGLRRVLESHLPAAAEITVTGYGNVLGAAASVFGLSVEDVGADLLREHDPSFPVVVCARIGRPS